MTTLVCTSVVEIKKCYQTQVLNRNFSRKPRVTFLSKLFRKKLTQSPMANNNIATNNSNGLHVISNLEMHTNTAKYSGRLILVSQPWVG